MFGEAQPNQNIKIIIRPTRVSVFQHLSSSFTPSPHLFHAFPICESSDHHFLWIIFPHLKQSQQIQTNPNKSKQPMIRCHQQCQLFQPTKPNKPIKPIKPIKLINQWLDVINNVNFSNQPSQSNPSSQWSISLDDIFKSKSASI